MGLGRWDWVPRRSGSSTELLAECESFLTGTIAELVLHRDGFVPVWMWTNLLAHGSEAEIRREYEADRRATGTVEDGWRSARSYVAGLVLERARQAGSLAEVQRSALVPLELRLAGQTSVEWWDEGQWVAAVSGALDAQRRAHRS